MVHSGKNTRASESDDVQQTHRHHHYQNSGDEDTAVRGRSSNDGGSRPRHRRQSSGGSSIKRKISSLFRRASLPHSSHSDSSKHAHEHRHRHHHNQRNDSDEGDFIANEDPEKQDSIPSASTRDSWSSKKNDECTGDRVGPDTAAEPSANSETRQKPKLMVGEAELLDTDLEGAGDESASKQGSHRSQVDSDEELEGLEEGEEAARQPTMMAHMPTFTKMYSANPAPGMWGSGESAQTAEDREAEGVDAAKPNMPLEPEEYESHSVPWFVEQMGMGEQPFSSLLDDYVGYINPRAYTDSITSRGSSGISNGYEANESDGDRKHDRKRQRKLAFEVIRRQLAEARVGIPKNPAAPSTDDFKRADGTVDYIGYGSSRIKHYADTQLRYKMDYRHSSDDPCKLDRFLLTLQRLVEVSAPYQRLVVWLYQLARWDRPKQTMWWCGAYFALLYLEMISLFLWLVPVFVVAYHRLRPSQAYQWLGFERPETSIIPRKFVQDASSSTIGKGLVANRMWEIWRETLGAQVHLILADMADWMERAKNCATWKRPWASRSVIVVLTCMGVFTYVVPAHVFQKLFGICVGVQFFFLAPLQLRHERYRRMLWVVDWILWHSPTDVELALDTLYTHSHSCREPSGLCVVCADTVQPTSFAAKTRRFAKTIASDLVCAYHPFSTARQNPVMILQTASSTCLDRLEDDIASSDGMGVGDALELGKRLGKRLVKNKGEEDGGEYTGLCASDSVRLPTMMKDYEEREWMRNAGYAHSVARAFSVDTLGGFEKEKMTTSQPAMIGHSKMLSQLKSMDLKSSDVWQETAPARVDASERAIGNSNNSSSGSSPSTDRSFMSRAKGLSSKILRRRSSQSSTKGESGSEAKANTGGSVAAAEADDLEKERKRRTMHSFNLQGMSLSNHPQEAVAGAQQADDSSGGRVSLDNILAWASVESIADSGESGSLELMHEANELSALRNRDARPAAKGVDLNSLYAFRCIHQGKYGTLFVTPDRFIFRRSRIMGGRRSSVSSHLLSSVVALRKSTSRFSKSHGIQLLLSDGSAFSYFGLARRDDVFGFLLVRCGHTHAF
ncbi:hypothetical protein IW140_004799 [Coemansia sp. RSA 1813]|nr:hypothetical protein LPJ74_003548 [Coemansia sp. RSA 1843]KAJ2093035.1 hypothetical protein IW138_000749 [Coemansia sp. RSA 986]KAJ2214057.1 hypothetical protein EV179_003301 [Coemansia sp. RSA 487]KAJ2566797.1 hypothetical protein IW140_004799 [Coemansia sp. RSA 1813]